MLQNILQTLKAHTATVFSVTVHLRLSDLYFHFDPDQRVEEQNRCFVASTTDAASHRKVNDSIIIPKALTKRSSFEMCFIKTFSCAQCVLAQKAVK